MAGKEGGLVSFPTQPLSLEITETGGKPDASQIEGSPKQGISERGNEGMDHGSEWNEGRGTSPPFLTSRTSESPARFFKHHPPAPRLKPKRTPSWMVRPSSLPARAQ